MRIDQRRAALGASLIFSVAHFSACGGVPPKASPTDPAGNFSQVDVGVYRGGRPDLAGIGALVKLGVKTIVDLENDDEVIATERAWATQAGIKFVSEPMDGLATPNDREVDSALAEITDPANQPVYVHCMQGHDRTGLLIALYRVFHDAWPPKEAHDEMMALGFNSILLAMNHYFEEKTHWDD